MQNAKEDAPIYRVVLVEDHQDYREQLQALLLDSIAGTALGAAELLNPTDGERHARFLAFRSPNAARWCAELQERGCITDVRRDVIRVGLALYHDEADVAAFAELARGLP